MASSEAGVTPCLCAAHGSGESCFSVASLFLLPSVSPSFALYFSQADDCDYVKPRLRRRPSEAEPAQGTKEGGEGRRKRGRAGGGEGGRPGEAGERYCPSLSATNGLLCRPRPSHYFVAAEATQKYVRARAKARETDERTDCRLRPMPPTTALATRRKRYMRAQKALSRLSSMVATCLRRRNECKRATYRQCSRFAAAAV